MSDLFCVIAVLVTACSVSARPPKQLSGAWVVSLELAAMNSAVLEAVHPDVASWDLVIFDEAHRLTPTAETFHRVGRVLAKNVPRALLLTATPHRALVEEIVTRLGELEPVKAST